MALGEARLSRAGGSLKVVIPAAATKALKLDVGTAMRVSIEGERVVLEKATAKVKRPRYTIDELMAQCDLNAPMSAEERAWIDAPRVGREVL